MNFPLFIELEGRRCLVVGAGPVARRKAAALGEFGAKVDMVAPELNHPFREADLDGAALGVAATDDGELNARVSALARARSIPVNVVDDPARCTFFFPAIFRKGPLVAAFSTGGTLPVAARMMRDAFAPLATDRFAREVERLGAERDGLKRRVQDPAARKAVYERALGGLI